MYILSEEINHTHSITSKTIVEEFFCKPRFYPHLQNIQMNTYAPNTAATVKGIPIFAKSLNFTS